MTVLFVDSSPLLHGYMHMLAAWGVTPEALLVRSPYQPDYQLHVARRAAPKERKNTTIYHLYSTSGTVFKSVEGIVLCSPTLWHYLPESSLPIYCMDRSAALKLRTLGWPRIQIEGAQRYSTLVVRLLKTVSPCHLLVVIADDQDRSIFSPLLKAGFVLSFYPVTIFHIQQLSAKTLEKISGSRFDGYIFFEPDDAQRFCRLAKQGNINLQNKVAFALNRDVQGAAAGFGQIINAESTSRWRLLSMVCEWVAQKNGVA